MPFSKKKAVIIVRRKSRQAETVQTRPAEPCQLLTSTLLDYDLLKPASTGSVLTCTQCGHPLASHNSHDAATAVPQQTASNPIVDVLLKDRAVARNPWMDIVEGEETKRQHAPDRNDITEMLMEAVEKRVVSPEVFLLLCPLLFSASLTEQDLLYFLHAVVTAVISGKTDPMIKAHNFLWAEKRDILKRDGGNIMSTPYPIMPSDNFARSVDILVRQKITAGADCEGKLPSSFPGWKDKDPTYGGDIYLPIFEQNGQHVANASILEAPITDLIRKVQQLEQSVTTGLNYESLTTHLLGRLQGTGYQRWQQNYQRGRSTRGTQRGRGRAWGGGKEKEEQETKDF